MPTHAALGAKPRYRVSHGKHPLICFLASRPLHFLLLLVLAALTGTTLWFNQNTRDAFGHGIGLVVPTAALYLMLLRLQPRLFLRRWNRWLAMTLAIPAAWGALGFFAPQSGATSYQSIGGWIGESLLGSPDAAGVARVAGLGALALAILAPRLAWHAFRRLVLVAFPFLWRAAWILLKTLWAGSSFMFRSLVVAAPKAFQALSWVAAAAVDTARLAWSIVASLAGAMPRPKQHKSAHLQPGTAKTPPRDAGSPENLIPESPDDLGLEVEDATSKRARPKPERSDFPPLNGGNGSLPGSDVPLVQTADADGWRLPSIDVLDGEAPHTAEQADNGGKARAIEAALASYGIDAAVVEINPGPAVTQFGVEPGWVRKFRNNKVRDERGKLVLEESGNPLVRREEISRTRVKVDAIANLDRDLAMALAAPSIRIEAPVPGKSMVGVEVPNDQSEIVTLRSGVNSLAFQRMKDRTKLTIVLGKGSGGQPEVADLGRMPHLLVAGATGSGKSIGLRAVLVSLLMYVTPRELRLLLIDPKRVELVAFNGLPHLIAPVIVDVEKTVDALRWAIREMEERYKKFATVGARNLDSYNKNKAVSDLLPYLLIMIDELADLMMAAPYDVEHSITRLAQLGRATGIHLVVATQRPSVDVVTGLIKANFPTRLSFAVSSLVDSRTILDSAGAEKLLGKGDMLYLPQDAPKPKRIQGVYVSDTEVERVVRAWGQQHKALSSRPMAVETAGMDPNEPPALTPDRATTRADTPRASPAFLASAVFTPAATATSPTPVAAPPSQRQDRDPLLPQAREVSAQYRRLSVSLLQRKMQVGYTKAAHLIALLEEEGYGQGDGDGVQ